jgi:formate--tetrahydrofolate ligase
MEEIIMELKNIYEIAAKAGIDEKYIEPYGKNKAKIDLSINETLSDKENGKLILVTAITPTKAGEGKTTMSIALTEGLNRLNKKTLLCLREPSLGPVFGIKGGATGGGKVTVEPSTDINLHFTGDMHALTSSINLISACIDNHIFQGNELNIDPNKIVWKRALDMNDRALREITISQGKKNGEPRTDGFVITVASELMAIMCLARDEEDFKARVKKIIVAYTKDDKPVTVNDLRITNAIMLLMKEALKPNLVQTNEFNPVLIHGGPFANIAHGCNSLIATKMALKLADYVVTEAGFGADLGAEKFLDIASQEGRMTPNLVVMVATIRALKMHGGADLETISELNLDALKEGVKNLAQHLENIKKFGLDVVVAINHFATDNDEEVDYLENWCKENGYKVSFVDGFLKGGEGALDLATKVVDSLNENKSSYHPLYNRNDDVKEKIRKIAREIYRADDVEFSPLASEHIEKYEKMGFKDAYICMAKTPQSFSDDAKVLNTPRNFILHVRDVTLSAGVNFLVVLTGSIMTMPGLPKVPAAVKMEDE